MSCLITPISAFESTNLNSKIDSFGRLADRIVRSIGAPLISIEAHQDQIFENISIACEMFTKFAGYTKEYLVFDSRMYTKGKGIRLDHLYTLANDSLTLSERLQHKTPSRDTSPYLSTPSEVYVAKYPISYTVFTTSTLSADLINGIERNKLLDSLTYTQLLTSTNLDNFFAATSTDYVTSSAFHTTLNLLPSSLFVGNSSLSSSGLEYNTTINDNSFISLSNVHPHIALTTFFKPTSALSYVLMDIPSSSGLTNFYSNNVILSSTKNSAVNSVSSIPISTFFSPITGNEYVVTTKMSSVLFASYSALSAPFINGLNVGNTIPDTTYYTLTATVSPYNTNIFFRDGELAYESIYPLSASLFNSNEVLSGLYPNGITVGTVYRRNQYPSASGITWFGVLSAPFNDDVNTYFNNFSLSTQRTSAYWTNTSTLPSTVFTTYNLSSYPNGLPIGTNILFDEYNTLKVITEPLLGFFDKSYSETVESSLVREGTPSHLYNNMFDYDVMSYRKVIDIIDFNEGQSSGINTLFTIEQTMAQQTYFSYAMGNFGFDLISWYCVKNWLETREKVLALKKTYNWNERNQILKIYPEPTDYSQYYALIECYVERPLRDIIKEMWVQQYALALTKISVGYVRGKYSGVNLFGGQVFNSEIKQDGMAEKERLEQKLYEGASAGFGDGSVNDFFVG